MVPSNWSWFIYQDWNQSQTRTMKGHESLHFGGVWPWFLVKLYTFYWCCWDWYTPRRFPLYLFTTTSRMVGRFNSGNRSREAPSQVREIFLFTHDISQWSASEDWCFTLQNRHSPNRDPFQAFFGVVRQQITKH